MVNVKESIQMILKLYYIVMEQQKKFIVNIIQSLDLQMVI